jgi:hypothetical protein
MELETSYTRTRISIAWALITIASALLTAAVVRAG